MSLINIISIQINNNPALFTSQISLTVTFECLNNISDEIEWKLVYVSSSNGRLHEQELESFTMGPLERGIMQFDVEADAPNQSRIPQDGLLGIAALIITTSYNGKEFFRAGYYVHNSYMDEQMLENPPAKVKIDAVYRNILTEKPRITRFTFECGDLIMEEEAPLEKAITSYTEATSSYLSVITNYSSQRDSDMTIEYESVPYSKDNVFEKMDQENTLNPFLQSLN